MSGGSTSSPSRLRRAWNRLGVARRWLWEAWPQVTATLGGLIIAAESVWLSLRVETRWIYSTPGVIFTIGVVMNLVGGIVAIIRTPRLKAIQDELTRSQQRVARLEITVQQQEQDYFDLVEHQLSILAEGLHFTADERISVYKHDAEAFVRLGRYSLHPVYTQPGRGIYPANQGCIGMAWNSGAGNAFADNLPDPETDLEAYYSVLESQWHIPRQTAASIRMKSRNFAAFAILNPVGDRRIAVIVFESTRTGVLRRDRLVRTMSSEGRRIAQLLEARQSQEPTPTYAQKEGY